MNNVKMPVNISSIIKLPVPEQIETMLANSVSFLANGRHFMRQMLRQDCEALLYFIGWEEKPAFRLAAGDNLSARIPVASGFGGDQVKPLANFLAAARADFVPVHTGKAQHPTVPLGGHRFPILHAKSLSAGCTWNANVVTSRELCGRVFMHLH